MIKRIVSIFMTILLLCSFVLSASAHSAPDMARKGTVQITMRHDDEVISGGTMTIFRVGDVYESDGNFSFVLTEAFAESGVSLDNLESATLAEDLAEYAMDENMKGTTKSINKYGIVVFDELELGLYLFVQQEAAKGYYPANPFVITVPVLEDGEYIYTIDGSPKLDPLKERPTEPTSSSTKPSGGKLPQTGQLNWPIPILAVAGLMLLAFGWMLCFGKKKDGHET